MEPQLRAGEKGRWGRGKELTGAQGAQQDQTHSERPHVQPRVGEPDRRCAAAPRRRRRMAGGGGPTEPSENLEPPNPQPDELPLFPPAAASGAGPHPAFAFALRRGRGPEDAREPNAERSRPGAMRRESGFSPSGEEILPANGRCGNSRTREAMLAFRAPPSPWKGRDKAGSEPDRIRPVAVLPRRDSSRARRDLRSPRPLGVAQAERLAGARRNPASHRKLALLEAETWARARIPPRPFEEAPRPSIRVGVAQRTADH